MPKNEDISGARKSTVDMTPMVDVTFLLLIFFMVTAAFTLQKSIAVPKPNDDDLPSKTVVDESPETETVTIAIDADNSFRLITADDEFECPSNQELYVQLRAAMSGSQPPERLVVRIHGESTHDRTIMALDACADVGLEDIQMVTVDE